MKYAQHWHDRQVRVDWVQVAADFFDFVVLAGGCAVLVWIVY